jgi:hypothetical protein
VSLTLPSTATGFTLTPHTRREDRPIARPASLLNPSFNRKDTFHAKRRAFVNLDSLPCRPLPAIDFMPFLTHL